MELGQRHVQMQKQVQTLHMTQQMEQSIRILQMDAAELREYIGELALENPAIDLDALSQDSGEQAIRRKKLEWLEQQARNDHQNIGYYDKAADTVIERAVANPGHISLEEHLLSQMGQIPDPAVRRAACYLAGCLDQDGYLRCPLQELSLESKIAVGLLEQGLEELKRMEPAGIGASTLEESLHLQLSHDDWAAHQIVASHLGLMADRKPKKIASILQIPLQEVEAAFSRIRMLNPRPGSAYEALLPQAYIMPEVVVTNFQDHYLVLPCDFQYPDVKISRYALELLDHAEEGELRSYLGQKIKEVEWLCKCIAGRNETLLTVAREIVKEQEQFFRHGPGYLNILRMGDIAHAAGIHESTVSRTVKNKYLQCSHGIYPLRYFFVQGASAANPEASSNHVMHRIAELIASEDKQKPLSDQKLSEILSMEGISISRRTVAKYRDQMKILKSSQRVGIA